MGGRAFVLGAAVVALAACGSGAVRTVGSREWAANVTQLVAQLRDDEVVGTAGTSDLASARHALHDDSDLYVLLVAYADFAGCGRMLANAGDAGGLARLVDGTLSSACVRLERAAALFTRSAGDDDPRALLAAAREAQRAWPLLDRALVELAVARR